MQFLLYKPLDYKRFSDKRIIVKDNKPSHFIFFLLASEYDQIKANRSFKLPTKRSKYKIKNDDQILIALEEDRNEKRVVAEYEATQVNPIEKGLEIILEPIYQAPPTNGLKINDLIKLSLKTELKDGKAVIKVSKDEFEMMAGKLVR